MKRFLWLIAITLLAVPVFAQDDGDGGFDIDGLFNGETPDNTTAAATAKIDLLADLRSWLAKANAPALEQKQEKPLNKLYEKEVKAMAKSFEKQFGTPLDAALAAQTPARGRRGAGINRTPPEQTAEIRRLSDQLVDKLIAGLRIDQQAGIRRYQSEQLRVKRLNAFSQSMALAGLPLTADQKVQIDGVYARESHLRTLIIVEAKGKPSQAKIRQLETQTTQRVVQLMNQTQKKALAEAAANAKAR